MPQLLSPRPRAPEPQLLCTPAREPVLPQRNPFTTTESSPHSPQLEKAHSKADPAQPTKKLEVCLPCFYLFIYWLDEVYIRSLPTLLDCPCSSVSTESISNAGDPGSIPGSGRSPGGGNGTPLQCSHLENPMDRGARLAIVHWVARVGHNLVTKPPPPSCWRDHREWLVEREALRLCMEQGAGVGV